MAGPPPSLMHSPAAGPASASASSTTAPTTSSPALSIPEALWNQQIPLIIRHASAPPNSAPFVTLIPRFSYLALLLPRLNAYFGNSGLSCSSFHHEDVLLRNLAVGLLADLYQPVLPWRLTVSDGIGWDIGDTFLNSAKEVRSLSSGYASFSLAGDRRSSRRARDMR